MQLSAVPRLLERLSVLIPAQALPVQIQFKQINLKSNTLCKQLLSIANELRYPSKSGVYLVQTLALNLQRRGDIVVVALHRSQRYFRVDPCHGAWHNTDCERDKSKTVCPRDSARRLPELIKMRRKWMEDA